MSDQGFKTPRPITPAQCNFITAPKYPAPMPPRASFAPEGGQGLTDHTNHVMDAVPREYRPRSESCIRESKSGATRDSADGKPEIHKYINPRCVARFCEYMLKHSVDSAGNKRDGDNWQKGMPCEWYMGSLMRHVHDLWLRWEAGENTGYALEETLCAIIFNAQGYLLEALKEWGKQ